MNSFPITTVLHIFMIHRPNFEENGSIFEVATNGQAFRTAKTRTEKVREKEIGINLKMMRHLGGDSKEREPS